MKQLCDGQLGLVAFGSLSVCGSGSCRGYAGMSSVWVECLSRFLEFLSSFGSRLPSSHISRIGRRKCASRGRLAFATLLLLSRVAQCSLLSIPQASRKRLGFATSSQLLGFCPVSSVELTGGEGKQVVSWGEPTWLTWFLENWTNLSKYFAFSCCSRLYCAARSV